MIAMRNSYCYLIAVSADDHNGIGTNKNSNINIMYVGGYLIAIFLMSCVRASPLYNIGGRLTVIILLCESEIITGRYV